MRRLLSRRLSLALLCAASALAWSVFGGRSHRHDAALAADVDTEGRRFGDRLSQFSLPLDEAGLGAAAAAEKTAGQDTDPKALKVDSHLDIEYFQGPASEEKKHRLDLFVPHDTQDFPTVLFVHGGAWVFGDKSSFGLYSKLGRMFASQGIACAVTNYRLSPGVQHPEHIKDVARAFAWVHGNIAKYHGRPDKIFLCGHSAGGHLVALLATNDSYLQAEGLKLSDVAGVAAISGVYNLPGRMFKEVFGTDEAVRRTAMPTQQVRAGCPPFLLIYGDHDFLFADRLALEFAKALKDKQTPAATLEIKDRNHITIIVECSRAGDPCNQAIVNFVVKHK